MKSEIQSDDEAGITDLQISPDGRIFIFGASKEIIEILEATHLMNGLDLDSQFENGSQLT